MDLLHVQEKKMSSYIKIVVKVVEIIDKLGFESDRIILIMGTREKTVEILRQMNPQVLDVLPLSLEEVFVYEMEALGYTFDVNPFEDND